MATPVRVPVVRDLAPATKPTSTQKAEIPRPIQKTSGMSGGSLSNRARALAPEPAR